MYLFDYLMVFLNVVLLVTCVLVSISFLTLFERKILSYIQVRKGPNKVGFLGIFQPFSDAIKLFIKEQSFPLMSNYYYYYFCPVVSLFLAFLLWVCLPFLSGFLNFKFSILYFFCLSSLGVYVIMVAGWSSNSSYSLLGSLRCVAQTISYEVSLALIFLSFLFLIVSLDMGYFLKFQLYMWFIFMCFPLSLIWFVSSLAETNRAPFDFAEGESELVSGFNIEYSSGGFALIFMAEYLNILFMSMLFDLIFLGSNFLFSLFYLKLVFLIFIFVWVRGTIPRFRYDKLMSLAWKSFLPVSLSLIFFFLGVKMFSFSMII